MKVGVWVLAWALGAAWAGPAEDAPGSCKTEDSRFQTEEAGCLHFSSGLVWSSQPQGKFTLKTAASYCSSLDEGGKVDWRLPKRQELQAIANETGAVDHLAIRRFSFFWAAGNPQVTEAWAVSLADGEVVQLPAGEAAPSLLCVRQPSDIDGDGVPDSSDKCNMTPPKERRADDNKRVATTGQWKGCIGADSVIDAPEVRRIGCAQESAYFQTDGGGCKHVSTGNVWSSRSPVALTHEYAVAYCSDLKEGLNQDWRLPSTEELRRLAGALQGQAPFKFQSNDLFWSTGQASTRIPHQGYNHFSYYHQAVQLTSGEVSHIRYLTEKHYCCPDQGSESTSHEAPVSRAVICVRN